MKDVFNKSLINNINKVVEQLEKIKAQLIIAQQEEGTEKAIKVPQEKR